MVINWWNSKTIQASPSLWKPSLQPISQTPLFHTPHKTWFEQSSQQFECPVPFQVTSPTFESKEIVRCRKIKLNPTRQQKEQLAKWWDHYRFTYNKTIETIINDVKKEGNTDDSKVRVIADMFVKDDGHVSLELGRELEPDRKITLHISENKTAPKVSAKIRVLKGKKTEGQIKLKIDVLKDPALRPLTVNFGFEYPASRKWRDYRDELVTATGVKSQGWYNQCPNLLETNKYIRTGAVQQAVSAYKTVCTNAKHNGTKGCLRTIFQKKKNAAWTMQLERSCISKSEVPVIGRDGLEKTIDAVKLCPSVMA